MSVADALGDSEGYETATSAYRNGFYVVSLLLAFLALGSLVTGMLRRVILPVKKAFVLIGQAAVCRFVRCSKVTVRYFKKYIILLMKAPVMLYNNKESKIRKNVENVVQKEEKRRHKKRSV